MQLMQLAEDKFIFLWNISFQLWKVYLCKIVSISWSEFPALLGVTTYSCISDKETKMFLCTMSDTMSKKFDYNRFGGLIMHHPCAEE